MSNDSKTSYAGAGVEVSWQGRLCIHAGECGRARGELFVAGRKPWCQPDLVDAEEIVDVVTRCPTGALSYEFDDGRSPETAPAENTVAVCCDGPLFFHGDLDVEGAPDSDPGLKFRAALCRCGKSSNKPFCDNSHRASGFSDYGSVGIKGPGVEAQGGRLEVKPVENGPLIVTGNLTLIAGSGRRAWSGTRTFLCRCGASENKPFCDGSHKRIGFESD